MNPFFHTDFNISDSLKTVRKSVLIYETIILKYRQDQSPNDTGALTVIQCHFYDKKKLTVLQARSEQ
jgi:hypothetical protein